MNCHRDLCSLLIDLKIVEREKYLDLKRQYSVVFFSPVNNKAI